MNKAKALGVLAVFWSLSAFSAHAAPILNIDVEAVIGPLGSQFDEDVPGSVNIEEGDVFSFSAKLTDLENTRSSGFRFDPTILEATARLNGAEFTFGNVDAWTRTGNEFRFDILGDRDFTGPDNFMLTGSGPLVEGLIFTRIVFFDENDPPVFEQVDSLADLIPTLDKEFLSLRFFESIMVTGPGSLRLSGGMRASAEITKFEYSLTDDAAVVPVPGAFVMLLSGLAFFGVGRFRKAA